jgi:leucyl aminopeptidase
MELRFAPLDLGSLDELKTEVLCLLVFADERPPRGASGLVDWRLCGRLSQLLASAQFSGEFDEALLLPPPAQRIAAERILLVGAGARRELDLARAAQLVRALMERVRRLRVRTAAVALPHASLPWLSAAQAIDLWLDASACCAERLDEVVIVDSHEAQKAMEPRIESAKRRALAAL